MNMCATCGGSGAGQPVVFCMGMGVDSAAILTWWLDQPEGRGFCLHEPVCLTAMTGDEYGETRRLMETHLLPLMRAHGVRYVQLARAGQSAGIGDKVGDTFRPVWAAAQAAAQRRRAAAARDAQTALFDRISEPEVVLA